MGIIRLVVRLSNIVVDEQPEEDRQDHRCWDDDSDGDLRFDRVIFIRVGVVNEVATRRATVCGQSSTGSTVVRVEKVEDLVEMDSELQEYEEPPWSPLGVTVRVCCLCVVLD